MYSTRLTSFAVIQLQMNLSCGNSVADDFMLFSDVTIMIDLPLNFYRLTHFSVFLVKV